MEKKWYIVNTQSSCEATAKTAIEDRIKTKNMEDLFGDVLIPQEEVVQLIKGKKATRSKKVFSRLYFC